VTAAVSGANTPRVTPWTIGRVFSELFWLMVLAFAIPVGILVVGVPVAFVVKILLTLLGWY
jgi:hypothetical protein